MVRRLKCLWHGHHWITVGVSPMSGYGFMEYTDQCVKCNKKRVEVVQEH